MRKMEQSFQITDAKEKNIVGEMLIEARRSAKLTRDGLSKALAKHGLEISASGISKWEQGTRTPTVYHMMALCQVLHIHNPLEMYADDLNSAGLKKLADYRDDLAASGKYAPVKPRNAEIEYLDVKLYNIAVSAGTGSFLDGEDYEMLRVPKDTVPMGTDFALRVSGNSMEPVYQNGQIVWVRETETIRPGEVGIFIHDGDSLMKLYEEREPDEGVIEEFTDSYGQVRPQTLLVSYNEAYAPRVILPTSFFKVVGRVLS